MVLKTVAVMGPQHGYGIARRIEQTSGDLLAINYGTLYPVLLELEQEGAIASRWGVSDNNRRAKFYRLTKAGQKQLAAEKHQWEETTEIIAPFPAHSCGHLIHPHLGRSTLRTWVRTTANGVKSFIINYRNADGRQRRATLGRFPALSATAARQRAQELLAEIHVGADPLDQQRARCGELSSRPRSQSKKYRVRRFRDR